MLSDEFLVDLLREQQSICICERIASRVANQRKQTVHCDETPDRCQRVTGCVSGIEFKKRLKFIYHLYFALYKNI